MTTTELLDELGVHWAGAGSHHHVNEGWVGIRYDSNAVF